MVTCRRRPVSFYRVEDPDFKGGFVVTSPESARHEALYMSKDEMREFFSAPKFRSWPKVFKGKIATYEDMVALPLGLQVRIERKSTA